MSVSTKTMLFILTIFVSFPHESVPRDIGLDKRVRSDVIVTKYNTEDLMKDEETEVEGPGIVRRTLLKFGQVASNIGNTLGRHSTKVTNAIEKICEIIKTIIPVISAVCGVGQFKFCTATEGVSDDFNTALHPNPADLNIQD